MQVRRVIIAEGIDAGHFMWSREVVSDICKSDLPVDVKYTMGNPKDEKNHIVVGKVVSIEKHPLYAVAVIELPEPPEPGKPDIVPVLDQIVFRAVLDDARAQNRTIMAGKLAFVIAVPLIWDGMLQCKPYELELAKQSRNQA